MNVPADSTRVDDPGPPLRHRDEEHAKTVRVTSQGAARLEGVRVLVVDDDPDVRELLRVSLEREGATVATTASVSEALAHIERVSPHVLVCDIAMPERDGYELLRVVHSLPSQQVARTSAIALTGLPEKVARERAYGVGYDAYMVKPVDFSQFVATVARFASWYAAA